MSLILSRDKVKIPIVLSQSLWDFFRTAGVHQQPEQSNYLAEGKIKLVNSFAVGVTQGSGPK